MNNTIVKLTRLSFLSLALIPMLKPNLNSISIIVCVILTMINIVHSKNTIKFNKQHFLLTVVFWMFLFHEIFSLDLNFDRILRHLPFLIIPLIFIFRPIFIDARVKAQSILVFQVSVIVQCFIYTIDFLINNNWSKLFSVSNENIPFFRDYTLTNSYLEIHPTYFSAFLLLSITFSLFKLLDTEQKKTGHLLNIMGSLFFLFLFSSRVILLILIITFILFIIINLRKKPKQAFLIIAIAIVTSSIIILPSKNILFKRFDEVRTEIKKPIVGDYYNSTNTRVAIIKCSLRLIQDGPFLGYGDALQSKLDQCYRETNDSDFYLKSTFNTHNYYFNLILYGGYLFLVLFLIYIYYLYKNLKHSLIAIFIISQLLIINLTENFLSRHYGIVLFVYFTSIFFFLKENNSQYKD
jgi:hypothetical protein